MTGRDNWKSRAGFIMAAAGSAVGLGNLWKFPYLTWENNGGAFVVMYFLAVFVIGLPLMMSEILVGRKTQLSPVPAFTTLGGKKWSVPGWLGVFSAAVIQAYYVVIAGWSLRSFAQCLGWSLWGYTAPGEGEFNAFLSNGALQIGLAFLFTLFTVAIVYRGIGGGIEKANKVMMPVLFAILIYLVLTALTMEGRNEALTRILVPDFSTLELRGILEAVGQAFFSLSLGLGAMVTYGSYLDKKESIFRSALWVVVLDTLIALLACVAMFTIIFSVPGLNTRVSGSTIGMLFITLPDLFYTHMPGGAVLGPLFFVLVAFAALSSTISLGEVTASMAIDLIGWTRIRATIVTTAVVFIGSILCALSLGASSPLSSFEIFSGKKGLFSTLDHLATNWMLPFGGFLIALFVGWKVGRKKCMEELGISKTNPAFTAWLWIVRIVAPTAVLFLLISAMMGKDFS